jgi:hypothetical protein
MDAKITIPVSATMRVHPDGSVEMIEAEYVTTTADAIARFLLKQFHIKAEKKEEGNQ